MTEVASPVCTAPSRTGTVIAPLAGMRTVLLLLLTACASYAEIAEPSETPTPTDTGDITPIDDGWFGLDGTLEVEQGEVTSGLLVLSVWTYDVQGRPALACTVQVQVQDPPAVSAPEDEVAVYGMWRIGLDVDFCQGAPNAVDIGIGPLPQVLWPTVDAAGSSLRHARGLYRGDQQDLVVFGFAGTQAQLAGRGSPTSLEPLPDGTYRIQTSYLLEL